MKLALAFASILACTILDRAMATLPVTGLSAPYTFESLPAVGDWASHTFAGAASSFRNVQELDAAVQGISALSFSNQLVTTQTVPPATGGTARWNSTWQLAQTRPAGVGAIALLATLQNQAGSSLTLYLQYDFTRGIPVVEEIPGYRVFYSRTGEPGSWILIPQLSGLENDGPHGTSLALDQVWQAGELLYLLWADDNAESGADPYLTIDNFTASTVICDSFYWLQPFTDLTVLEGQPASFSINLCPHEQFDFQWYKNGVAIPGATSNAIVFPRTRLTDAGTYYTSFSRHATLTVVPDDEPPRALVAWRKEDADPLTDLVVVRFSERMASNRVSDPANYWLQGGSNGVAIVLNVFTADETNVVLEVEPLEDGPYFLTVSNLTDQSAALHILSPNPTLLEVQRFQGLPAVPANAVWRYWEAPANTNDTSWREPLFDDSTWPSGQSAFGFPASEVLPSPYSVQTVISCASCGGPNTTWFRTWFALTAEETNALIELQGVFDDGAVVYLNGREVWRIRLPAGLITSSTFATNSYEPHLVDGPIELYAPGLLRVGFNTLAVEVHQSSVVNGDVFMGLTARTTRGVAKPRLSIEPAGGESVTVRWTGAGTLQVSSTVDAPSAQWQDLIAATNSFTTNLAAGALFFRVRR